jgi:putative salt-induced outer membrane protein
MVRKAILVLTFLSLSVVAGAQEEAEEEGPWSGSLSLGYLSTSGNTETTSYNTKFGVNYKKNDWEHILSGSSNGAEDTSVSTAESYQLGWRSGYNFTEHDFVFGTVDWRKDRFSGVTEQLSAALNYGRRVIDTPSHQLALGIGAGYRDSDRSDGTTEAEAIGRGSLAYDWIWSETSSFDQDLIIESGSSNTYIESVSAIRARIIGDFNLVLSYTIKQNTDVPAGSDKTDTQTAISIEYAF